MGNFAIRLLSNFQNEWIFIMKLWFLCLILIHFSTEEDKIDCPLKNDFQTVAITKARGRIGNHLWLFMKLVTLELVTDIKTYLTEDTRWIFNEYFKGFAEDTYASAEKALCGFAQFYQEFEWYLDNKIIDHYEEKSGIRIPIVKPKDKKWATNHIKVPPSIGLKYPLSMPDLVKSEEFIKNEPKDYKVENCAFTWNTFRGSVQDLRMLNRNHAFWLWPGDQGGDQDRNLTHSNTASILDEKLQFKDEFVIDAQEKLTKVKTSFKSQKKETIFVGIHSRRTDHLNYQLTK